VVAVTESKILNVYEECVIFKKKKKKKKNFLIIQVIQSMRPSWFPILEQGS